MTSLELTPAFQANLDEVGPYLENKLISSTYSKQNVLISET